MGHLFQKMNEGVPESGENSNIHSAGIVATRTYKVYNNHVYAYFVTAYTLGISGLQRRSGEIQDRSAAAEKAADRKDYKCLKNYRTSLLLKCRRNR